jgi:hypothetical protein
MSYPEHHPFRQREQTRPGGYAAPSHDATLAPPAPPPRRHELMALRSSETPRARLFNPNALDHHVDWSAVSSAALTVDAQPTQRCKQAFRNDTHRPWNRARLLSALRITAAWVGAAALLIVGLVWSLSEDEIPQTERARVVAAQPKRVLPLASPAPPAAASPALAAVAPAPPPSAGAPTPERAPSIQKPAEPPRASAAIRPRSGDRDDAASPFGKWIVPPRD